MTTRQIEVFFSYSHKDQALRDELETHLSALKRQGKIRNWHDRKILPGAQWSDEIAAQLDAADLTLLLIRADFQALVILSGLARRMLRLRAGLWHGLRRGKK